MERNPAVQQPTRETAEQPQKVAEQSPEVAEQPEKPAGRVSTGARKWERRVFHPAWTRDGKRIQTTGYSVRIAHRGRREEVLLNTNSARVAAARAARFHGILKVNGWDAAHADLTPGVPAQGRAKEDALADGGEVAPAAESLTVGDMIRACERVATHCSPITFRQYCNALRWLASHVAGISGDGRRYDYKTGGLDQWRAQVEAVPLAALTPATIKATVAAYIMGRGSDPSAKRTAAAQVRQARGLWSRQMLDVLPIPVPNPFADLRVAAGRCPKYVATFSAAELVVAARAELRDDDPEAWKTFQLLLGAGLRRSEADVLLWSNVNTKTGTITVTAGKTEQSAGNVQITPELAAELGRGRSGEYVLAGGTRVAKTAQRVYRAEATWARLARWLHAHGVTDRKPLHTLRKEAGSLVNAAAGIHAASRFLRHGGIAVTADHYIDGRAGVAVTVFDKGA